MRALRITRPERLARWPQRCAVGLVAPWLIWKTLSLIPDKIRHACPSRHTKSMLSADIVNRLIPDA
jgi:hypothetical protein